MQTPKRFNILELEEVGPNISVATEQTYRTCSVESILVALADLFLISRKISRSVIFSDTFLLANYPEVEKDPRLFHPKTQKYLKCSDKANVGYYVHSLLLFIENHGVMTTRCLAPLPRVQKDMSRIEEHEDDTIKKGCLLIKRTYRSIPPNSCYYPHSNLYKFFLRDLCVLASLESNPKHVFQAQEVIKRHILTYGPVVTVFVYSDLFKEAFFYTLKYGSNPIGMFLEYYDYRRKAILYPNTAKSIKKPLQYHSMNIIGWGERKINKDLLLPSHIAYIRSQLRGNKERLAEFEQSEKWAIPYWVARNTWGWKNTQSGMGIINYAMYPFNTITNLEGVQSALIFGDLPSSPDSEINTIVTTGAFLFKAGRVEAINAQEFTSLGASAYGYSPNLVDFYQSRDPIAVPVPSSSVATSKQEEATTDLDQLVFNIGGGTDEASIALFSQGQTPFLPLTQNYRSSNNKSKLLLSKNNRSFLGLSVLVIILIIFIVCIYIYCSADKKF